MIRLLYGVLLLIVLWVPQCAETEKTKPASTDLETIQTTGELHVLTLYSSVSYFLYKDEEMGYEYELIRDFAKKQGLKLRITVAENISRLTELLENGTGDIVAYPLPHTKELRKKILFCGQEIVTHQVLVQRQEKGRTPLTDVTGLIGKKVYVEKGSKYESRIRNLNEELGGGIEICQIDKDTLTTEDLIGMVASGEIDYTLANNNLAVLNKTYYRNLDIKLAVSFPQRSSWAVRKTSPRLAAAVNEWIRQTNQSPVYKSILKRYFEYSKQPPYAPILSLKDGRISVYDDLFKKYAAEIGWDWRLMASQAYHESHFDTMSTSWAGAKGLMQLMPATARAFGLGEDSIRNPEANLKAATASLKVLNRSFSAIGDSTERIKFILAAYNSGAGHIYDAMALARKYGKDPSVWDRNTSDYILLKSNPEYFNDSVCRFGYFRGRETFLYVKEILERYEEYKKKIPY